MHNAYLTDTSALKSTNAHVAMWEELNTDTTETTIHDNNNPVSPLFFDVID